MRFRVIYQLKSSNTSNQALIKNVLLPLALKTFDKYFQVGAAGPGRAASRPLPNNVITMSKHSPPSLL
jgi:hypothetical protein